MMRAAVALALLCGAAAAQANALARDYAFAERAPRTGVEQLVDRLLPSVVKVHGASGLSTIEAYASGIVVGEQGHVLTLDLAMIQAGQTRVVLHDGSVHDAEVLPPDARLGVRMLKIDPGGRRLVALPPSARRDWGPGALVVSIGNSFRLAEFSEKVSATFGVLTARARTGLRYRMADVDYGGELLITDAPNNPGHYGGGLFALSGEWIGLNGRIMESVDTNTEISAAIPAWELVAYVEWFTKGISPAAAAPVPPPRPVYHGIVLFDSGLRRSPPAYVERVEPGSPAAAAGLRPDDLIVRLDGQSVRTCAECRRVIAGFAPGRAVLVTFKRGDEVKTCELRVAEAKE